MTQLEALEARLRPLKVSEYLALSRLGAFEHERVELIRGRVVTMAAVGPRHVWTSGKITRLLVQHFGHLAEILPGAPLHASEDSMPEPDFLLAPLRDRPGPHPKRALLLVEISVSSLRDDRLIKAPLYAEGGSPEYWIVDVAHGRLEVYRKPSRGRWRETFTLGAADSIRPVSFPEIELPLHGFLLEPSDEEGE